MKRIWLIIRLATVLFILIGVNVQGQEEYNFLPDREAYNQELERFFEKFGNQKDRSFIKDFYSYTTDNELEENEWIAIAEISNIIVGRQNRPFTYLQAFIEAICSFQNNPDRLHNFPAWNQYVKETLFRELRKMQPLAELFEFTINLHQDKTLYSSPTITWKISKPDYKFVYQDEFYVQADKIDMSGMAGRDSSRIQATSGRYYPATHIWKANGGKISWEKVGLDNDLVFIRLDRYTLDLSKSVYDLDSVNLYDSRYFSTPIPGKFQDKISVGVRPERSGYPKFFSYDSNHSIKSIFRNMDYSGGYSLEGLKKVGSDMEGKKGQIIVYESQKPFMELYSHRYVFDEDGAKGLNTSVTIYLESDSIIHPGLFFQYKNTKNELVLMRDGTGSSNSKFFDSYHQMTLDVGMLSWFPGDQKLYLSGMVGALENNAVFESADFFSLKWFSKIQMADLKNPLILVKQFADYMGSRYFYSNDLAKFMKKPINLVEEMLYNVSYEGFVRIDTDTKLIHVQQRTYDFLEQHAGLMDYDMISFKSDIQPPNPNAIIELQSGDMKVLGVREISISDSRNVSFLPDKQIVTVKKGRNMDFDGIIKAGLLSFTGSDHEFIYDDFKLQLNKVDVIRLKVHIPLLPDYQETQLADLSSVIENTRGTLQVDSPDNKAGLEPENNPDFPWFRFDTTAYVYYDQKNIQNGAYTRDSFFFEIHPNTVKGLNDLRFREKLFFPGTFYTYNIFPALELDLAYRNDNSLGFETFYTPEEGYPVYIDKGTFFNEISMNTSGLRGNGTLTYLGATIESEQFLFLPDRVRAHTESIIVDENSSEYGNPEIIGQKMDITWFPGNNRLAISHLDDPLDIYGSGKFTGEIFVEPDAIKGSGQLDMMGYSVISEGFTFMNESFNVENGELYIHSGVQSDPGTPMRPDEQEFIASHFDGQVDLKNNIAEFKAVDDLESILKFPLNQYNSNQKSFIWNIEGKHISLDSGNMLSTRRDQNELEFDLQKSEFDIAARTIEASGIPFIKVSDVKIIPGDSKALIRADAVMDSLHSASIVSRDTTLGHQFRNSTVKIKGKGNYSASGNYIYTDIAGRELPINFYELGSSSGRPSKGKARVDSLAPFFLSPEFKFVGSVDWQNQDKLLEFKGSYMLTSECPNITNQWVRMDTKINPDSVLIPVDSISRSLEGETLRQGFYISNQPVELYSTFLGPHLNFTDHPVISSFGEIGFDYERGEYAIYNPALKDSIFPGSELRFNKEACISSASGRFDYGLDLGQVNYEAAGYMKHSLPGDSIFSDGILALDFFLDDKLLEILTSNINNMVTLSPVNYTRQEYRDAIRSWLGKARGNELLDELSLMGSFRNIPDEFNHTFLLTDLKMKWNPEKGSWQSVGPIGIANIGKTPVNKMVNGHLELVRRRSGDTFTFYIEFDSRSYFYFYYNRGLMQVLAGAEYEEFNNRVRSLKPKKRRLKIRKGPQYEFTLGQFRLVRNFLDEVRNN